MAHARKRVWVIIIIVVDPCQKTTFISAHLCLWTYILLRVKVNIVSFEQIFIPFPVNAAKVLSSLFCCYQTSRMRTNIVIVICVSLATSIAIYHIKDYYQRCSDHHVKQVVGILFTVVKVTLLSAIWAGSSILQKTSHKLYTWSLNNITKWQNWCYFALFWKSKIHKSQWMVWSWPLRPLPNKFLYQTSLQQTFSSSGKGSGLSDLSMHFYSNCSIERHFSFLISVFRPLSHCSVFSVNTKKGDIWKRCTFLC